MTKPSKVYKEEVENWLKNPVTKVAFKAMISSVKDDQTNLIKLLMQSELDDRGLANEVLKTKAYTQEILDLAKPDTWVPMIDEAGLLAKEDDE